VLDPVHAQVGDGERAVFEVRLLELCAPGPLDQIGPGGGDLGERQPVGATDDRHDEAAVRGDGHPHVRGREASQGLVLVVRVHLRVPKQRCGGGLRDEVGDCRLRLPLARELDEPLPEFLRPRHVRRHRDLEDRCLPRLRQAAGDRLADRGQLLDLGLARDGERSGGGRGGLGALHVLGDDPAVRPGAAELGEIDTSLPRNAPREW
jgi:hypothetical protein